MDATYRINIMKTELKSGNEFFYGYIKVYTLDEALSLSNYYTRTVDTVAQWCVVLDNDTRRVIHTTK